jgi:hypothetical protein
VCGLRYATMVPKQQVLAATVAALALSSAQAAADPATPGTGFFLTEAAKTKGAVCLDGTPGAYCKPTIASLCVVPVSARRGLSLCAD